MRVGLIGYPVKHSISPVFQQAAFDALGLDLRYELWETPPERLSEVVRALRGVDCLGANVTIPHKQAMLSFLDTIDPIASAIGAVNTIVHREDGSLAGFNTDVEGFARSVREDGATDLCGARVVVLGSGGAARAVVAAVLSADAATLTICSRLPENAHLLLNDLIGNGLRSSTTTSRIVALADSVAFEQAIQQCDVLVNATPVGMASHGPANALLIEPRWLRREMVVCDLIYNPPVTPLLAAAAAAGARTLNGLPMLVYQGAAAFERWTNHQAPVDLMRQKAMEALHV